MANIYIKNSDYNLLPNDLENITPNIFANATLKTFALILTAQGLYYLSWKRNPQYIRATRYFLYRKFLVIPYAYFWYRQLNLEIDNLNIKELPKPAIEPVKQVEPPKPVVAKIVKEEPVKVVKETPKVVVKDPPKVVVKEEPKVVVAPPKQVEKKVEVVTKAQPKVIKDRISLEYIIK
jgi:hypothetical protein